MKNTYKKIRYHSYDMTIKVDIEALHALVNANADSILTMSMGDIRHYGELAIECLENDVNDMDADIRDRSAHFTCYYGAVAWDAWYTPQFSWEEKKAEEEPTRPVSYSWEQEEPVLYNGTLCLTLEELLKHAND